LLPWIFMALSDAGMATGVAVVALGGAAAIVAVCVLGALRGRTGLSMRLPAGLRNHVLFRLAFDLATVTRVIFRAPVPAGSALVASLAVSALNAAIIYILLIDLGAVLTLFESLLLVPTIMEIAMLPITISGWGVREGLMVAAFSSLGIDGSIALGSSILFGLGGLAFALTGGVLWLMSRPHRSKGSMAGEPAAAPSPAIADNRGR
ncbi:MAG: hypothetical protein D6826_11915, partial [Alphaproteobacteria bacterium]